MLVQSLEYILYDTPISLGSNIANVLHFALNRKGSKRLTLFTTNSEQNYYEYRQPCTTFDHYAYPKLIADNTKRYSKLN